MGPGARDKDCKLIPVTLKEGDTVLLPEYGGAEVKLGEKEWVFTAFWNFVPSLGSSFWWMLCKLCTRVGICVLAYLVCLHGSIKNTMVLSLSYSMALITWH